ncbi:MAG: hypothetical protein ABR909_09050 [Candidatus Bathyarchaeia archaeon]
MEKGIMAKPPKSSRAIDDPEWVEWARTKTEKNLAMMPELKPLQDRLLSLGGDWVALEPEPDLDSLLDKGRLIKGRVILKRISPHNCHKNCCELWEKNPKTCRIATGWALSSDGIWRQHTWLLKGKAIIETTEPRTLYYGIVLGDKEAINFWWQNQ